MRLIPFANDTITIVHRRNGSWVSAPVDGCSYRQVRRRTMNGNSAEITEETVCRIPAGGVVPAVGDVILLGRHRAAAANEIELVRLMDTHRADGAFRVESVADNARVGMVIPHYAARGK